MQQVKLKLNASTLMMCLWLLHSEIHSIANHSTLNILEDLGFCIFFPFSILTLYVKIQAL